MGHVSGAARKLGGGNRVSSSDNGDGTLLLGEVGEDVNDSESSGGELFKLKDSHGSVHDDGLAVSELLLLVGSGLRTVVKSHPALGDGIGLDDLGLGILVELVGDNNVNGKDDLLSELLGLGEDLLGGVNKVVLDKRGSDLEALGLEEGEDHASSDDNLVALVKKGVEDRDLGRNLGSSNNGGHGLLSVLDGSVKVLELLGEKESRHGGLEELGHTLGGGVGTVGGTEGVVDVKVEGSGELLNELGLVLGLLGVEPGVLEHDDITLGGISDDGGNIVTDAVRGEGDILAKELSETLGAGSEGELVLRAVLGPSKVGADGDDGTLALEELNGGDRRADTGVIRDGLSVKGDVHVATDEDLLALELGLGEVLNGLLGLKLKVESTGRGADSEGGCVVSNKRIDERAAVAGREWRSSGRVRREDSGIVFEGEGREREGKRQRYQQWTWKSRRRYPL